MNFFALCLVPGGWCFASFQEGISKEQRDEEPGNTGWLPTCHMNLYELFALKRIDRHDERVKSTAKGCPGFLALVHWSRFSLVWFRVYVALGVWVLSSEFWGLGSGVRRSGRAGSLLICQARHVNAANYFALLLRCKIENSKGRDGAGEVEVAEWLTWQHASHIHLPVPVAPLHSTKSCMPERIMHNTEM